MIPYRESTSHPVHPRDCIDSEGRKLSAWFLQVCLFSLLFLNHYYIDHSGMKEKLSNLLIPLRMQVNHLQNTVSIFP